MLMPPLMTHAGTSRCQRRSDGFPAAMTAWRTATTGAGALTGRPLFRGVSCDETVAIARLPDSSAIVAMTNDEIPTKEPEPRRSVRVRHSVIGIRHPFVIGYFVIRHSACPWPHPP